MGKRMVVLSNTTKRASTTLARLPQLGFDDGAIEAAVTGGEQAWNYIKVPLPHNTRRAVCP